MQGRPAGTDAHQGHSAPEFEHPRLDVLLPDARERVERWLQVVELGERELGLVYRRGKLTAVLRAAFLDLAYSRILK